MKFSIGYQLPDEYFSTYSLCRDYGDKVSDVYFSFSNEPSGRFSLSGSDKKETEEIRKFQLEELREIKKLGKTLTLLYNANCYGVGAVSKTLAEHILSLTTFLKKELDIDHITTTSPFIAEVVKKEFADSIKLRASVNMRIGTVAAMEQLSEYFDGFYMQKECNRNFKQIEKLSEWCNKNHKKLHILANSGCMQNCAFQTFHDNLIAHGVGETSVDNVNMGYSAPCHKYLSGLGVEQGMVNFMQSNWIRPEEVYMYEKYFDEMKLATRMHSRPAMVLAAFARGKFSGNLLDLTEPSYSSLFRGYILDNTKIPESWFLSASSCNKNCDECNVCNSVIKQAVYKIQQN